MSACRRRRGRQIEAAHAAIDQFARRGHQLVHVVGHHRHHRPRAWGFLDHPHRPVLVGLEQGAAIGLTVAGEVGGVASVGLQHTKAEAEGADPGREAQLSAHTHQVHHRRPTRDVGGAWRDRALVAPDVFRRDRRIVAHIAGHAWMPGVDGGVLAVVHPHAGEVGETSPHSRTDLGGHHLVAVHVHDFAGQVFQFGWKGLYHRSPPARWADIAVFAALSTERKKCR